MVAEFCYGHTYLAFECQLHSELGNIGMGLLCWHPRMKLEDGLRKKRRIKKALEYMSPQLWLLAQFSVAFWMT